MELKNQTHNLENINEQFYLCMYPIIMSQMEYNWTVSSLPYLSAQLYYVPEGWLVRRGSHDHWNHLAHISQGNEYQLSTQMSLLYVRFATYLSVVSITP